MVRGRDCSCIFLAFFVAEEYNSFQRHRDSTHFDSIFAEYSHAEGVVRYGNLSDRANCYRAKAPRRRVRLGLERRTPDHQRPAWDRLRSSAAETAVLLWEMIRSPRPRRKSSGTMCSRAFSCRKCKFIACAAALRM